MGQIPSCQNIETAVSAVGIDRSSGLRTLSCNLTRMQFRIFTC